MMVDDKGRVGQVTKAMWAALEMKQYRVFQRDSLLLVDEVINVGQLRIFHDATNQRSTLTYAGQ